MGEISFEAIAGTYEEFLLGYTFTAQGAKLTQTFAARDHNSSVRCVAVSETYLASGGADDRIVVYDMKQRKEHCWLTHHNGTINCLAFINNTHLISGDSEGVLSIVRIGNWQVEKVWENAHKGSAIIDVAVHDSGKLALTLGADCTLRTWNLIKGRQAYTINLSSKCKDAKSLDRIVWAPGGVEFLLSGGPFTQIWSIETGSVLQSIDHSSKVICAKWLSNEHVLVGYENGNFGQIDVSTGTVTVKNGHESRIKSLTIYKNYLISASSGGEIKIWSRKLKEIAKCDTGCRITCLCVVSPVGKIKNEPEKVEVNVEDSDEEKNPSPKKKKKRAKKANNLQANVEDQEENLDSPKKQLKKENDLQANVEDQEENLEQLKKATDSQTNADEEKQSNAPKKKKRRTRKKRTL